MSLPTIAPALVSILSKVLEWTLPGRSALRCDVDSSQEALGLWLRIRCGRCHRSYQVLLARERIEDSFTHAYAKSLLVSNIIMLARHGCTHAANIPFRRPRYPIGGPVLSNQFALEA